MHKFIVIFVTLLISISVQTLAADLEIEEIELRETPQKMYDRLNQSISFPISFKNREQFERAAKEQGYSPDEFEHILQLLARLNLEPSIKSKVGFQDANSLIELLASIAQTPFQQATVAMLKGRYIGRTEQKYQEAIAFYNQALTLINDSVDLESMLLKHTIHE
ncbi:MAG: tetratricopeptide repeat protein, partial [Shewanella sp.]